MSAEILPVKVQDCEAWSVNRNRFFSFQQQLFQNFEVHEFHDSLITGPALPGKYVRKSFRHLPPKTQMLFLGRPQSKALGCFNRVSKHRTLQRLKVIGALEILQSI